MKFKHRKGQGFDKTIIKKSKLLSSGAFPKWIAMINPYHKFYIIVQTIISSF